LSLITTTLAASERLAAHVVIICIDGCPAYLLEDPKSPIPNLRQLAHDGVAAAGMRVVNPSVTWPNHTSLVTGLRPDKHGVLANGILTRHGTLATVTIDPRHDQAELIHGPTLFDVAHEAGLTTAAINWPCTRNSPTIDDNFPDVPEALTYTTPRLRDELAAEGAFPPGMKDFIKNLSSPQRDQIWTEATRLAIKRRKPSLTVLHLLNVDGTHHQFGPQTPSGHTAIALADACVGRVLDALNEAGIRDQTAVLIVADHGFTLTPKAIKPNALLRREGFLTAGRDGKVEEPRAHVVPEGGMGLLYFTDPGLTAEEQQRIRRVFEGHEGIAQVVEPQQFSQFGLPNPKANQQMADLALFAKDGFGFSGKADGEVIVASGEPSGVVAGNHGFDANLKKMNAVFVASGAGLKTGVRLDEIANIDVAPTVAALLGLALPTAEGRLLTEALSKAPTR
jgi:predicted AlkP superfamily pyrophosphatase or phosphodiesterase